MTWNFFGPRNRAHRASNIIIIMGRKRKNWLSLSLRRQERRRDYSFVEFSLIDQKNTMVMW